MKGVIFNFLNNLSNLILSILTFYLIIKITIVYTYWILVEKNIYLYDNCFSSTYYKS